MAGHEECKRTPLYEQHVKAGARLVPFAGFWMPLQFDGIADEHRRVRSTVGLFDVSHMGEIVFRGEAALATLQGIVTNDIAAPPVGKAIYTPVCLESGGIVDDMIVYKVSDREFFICVNASNKDKDFRWFVDAAAGACEVMDLSDGYAQVAVQGPSSPALIGRVFGNDLSAMKPFTFRTVRYRGSEVILATTGYTGERGWEVYLPNPVASDLWTELLGCGADLGVGPIGLGARDTLRLEMDYCLYGNDIDETTTPLEAGIEWTVKFEKGDFIGRDALAEQKARGIGRRLVPFVMEDKGIPRHGYPILAGGEPVGHVTSGTLSPSLNVAVGLGYVAVPHCETGTLIEVDLKGLRRAAARVVQAPLYKRSK